MNGAFYIGATGLQAHERGLQAIANNISNINTDGFKRSEVSFDELLTRSQRPDEVDLLDRAFQDELAGVRSTTTRRVFEQGDLKQTGDAFDLAISGDGFIELLGPHGETYLWRGGKIKIGADGQLETANGYPFKATVEIPEHATEIRIGRDGIVTAQLGANEPRAELGAIELALVRDTSKLEAVGEGFYKAASDDLTVVRAPGEDNAGVLVQGNLEASNVDLSTEIVSLLLVQRAYAANAQVVQAGDQLMAIANGLRR